MSLQSMTGFAREAGTTGPYSWAWEAKTVNGRGLDVRLRVPPTYEAVGEEARKLVAAALSRGQCQLNLSVTRAAETGRVRVNRELLHELLKTVADLNLPGDVRTASLDGILAIRGVVEVDSEGSAPPDELGPDVVAGARRLVERLKLARADEGAALEGVLSGLLRTIGELVDAAEACPARQPDAIRKRLAEQVSALIAGAVALDPTRLHAEAALLATRADIREEIDRLRAHVASGRELLAESGPVGRRLDFLAQELGREANTLCAKANDVALSRIGLDLKVVVDQFREQVQNVE